VAGAPPLTLNDVVVRHLSGRGRREDLYAPIRTIMRETTFAPSPALVKLAQIADFDLYLTTTFDSLLEDALNTARFAGVRSTDVLAYAPSKLVDLPSTREKLPRPLVDATTASKRQIALTEPRECRPIAADNFRVEDFRGRENPRVVFAQSLAGPRLHQGAPSRVRPTDSVYRETRQRPRGRIVILRAFEKLLHAHDREAQLSPVQTRQQGDRRSRAAGPRLALERNEKRRIKQDGRPIIHVG
jgi:hypothetical protein